MKKSQTKSKSSAGAPKQSAKKTAALPLKTAKKNLKKPEKSTQAKTENKKKAGSKASAAAKKVPAKITATPVPSSKTSAQKKATGKTATPATKIGSRKTVISAKKIPAKPAGKRTKTGLAAVEPAAKTKKPKVPEIRKTSAGKSPAAEPVKSSEKPARAIKKPQKETAKALSSRKPLAAAKKPATKSAAKAVAPTTKTMQKTAAKSTATTKTAPGKAKAEPVKGIKTAAAKGGAKTKKMAEKKPVPRKKPLRAETAIQIKAPAKQKKPLKPKEKESVLLAPGAATIRKRVAPSLTTAAQLPETGGKTTETYAASPIAASRAEKKQKTFAPLKVFLPEEELRPEEARQSSAQLPEEYGENELLLMEVDPSVVFVSWEIKPDCISCKTGKLTLRVYDVTGSDSDAPHTGQYFDIGLAKRVDSKFIDIKMPGRDVIMEIGTLQPDGAFEMIKRSNRVSMPSRQTLDEHGVSSSFSGPDSLIGY